MTSVSICCEGPGCNAGHSATDREAAIFRELPSVNADTRDEALRYARRTVSAKLAVTPHVRCGISRYGTALFACQACAFERVYGGSLSGFYS